MGPTRAMERFFQAFLPTVAFYSNLNILPKGAIFTEALQSKVSAGKTVRKLPGVPLKYIKILSGFVVRI